MIRKEKEKNTNMFDVQDINLSYNITNCLVH